VKEASIEVDLSKLRTLFDAIRPHIAKGFGESQTAQIESDFRALPMGGAKQFTFPIVHDGADSELRVRIRKEDVDIVEIHFFAVPKLAEQIEHVMRTTPLDVSTYLLPAPSKPSITS
jgi:vacuolar-type H+-ATPase subunit F/Vma7